MVSQAAKLVLGIGSTAVLARLLTPQDFGLIAMATVIIGFVSIFKDMGLSMATVQQEEINHQQVSTLFWINVIISVVLMIVTAGLAPAVAWFYGDPRLTWITVALAGTFIFGGLTMQHQALLRRQMRFTALAAIALMSSLVGIITAIGLAWYGIGYWALVASTAAAIFTNFILVWTVSGWRPGLPARGSAVGSLLAFGGNLTGFSFVNYFARNADNLLIGWYWGAAPLGLYSKAYRLLMLPLEQINAPLSSVAIPALSRLQHDHKRYRRAYLGVVQKIGIITMPGTMFLICTSDWIVKLLLGPQWIGAIPIFTWLGIAALFQPISNTTGWLFITQDRTREMFHWGVVGGALTTLSFAIVLPWGPIAMAAAYSLTSCFVKQPILFWFVGRRGPVRSRDFYLAMSLPLSLAASVGVVLAGFRLWGAPTDPVAGLILAMILAVTISLGVLASLTAGRRVLHDLFALAFDGMSPVIKAGQSL